MPYAKQSNYNLMKFRLVQIFSVTFGILSIRRSGVRFIARQRYHVNCNAITQKELEGLVDSYETLLSEASDLLREVVKNINERGERQRLKELLERRNLSDSVEMEDFPYRLDIAETSDRRHPEVRQKSELMIENGLNIETLLSTLVEVSSIHSRRARTLSNLFSR